MVVYSRILQILGCFNFIIGVVMTVYGTLFPNSVKGGTIFNSFGAMFLAFSLVLMLVLVSIFYAILGKGYVENLVRFTPQNIVLYIIIIGNMIYRFFWRDIKEIENGSSLTCAKLMAGCSVVLYLNFTIVLLMSNYLNK